MHVIEIKSVDTLHNISLAEPLDNPGIIENSDVTADDGYPHANVK